MDLFRSLVPEITRRQLAEVMEEYDRRDLAAMSEYMDYYRNDLKPMRPDGMSDDTYRDRSTAWVGVPLAGLLCDTIGGALYNRDVNRTTGNEQYDKALEAYWQALRIPMLQNARLASVVGDTVVRLMPDWRRGLRVSIWSGQHIVPIYNPDDPQEVVGLIYDYVADPIASQIGRVFANIGGASGGAGEARLEIITRHIRDNVTGEIVQPGIRARFIDEQRVPWSDNSPHDGYNPLGDFLDGVFWRNQPDPTSCRGQSDLAHVLPMIKGINESTTDARLLLEWFIYPILWTSADMEEQPEYSHKAVWQLGDKPSGQASEAGMIEWSGNMAGFQAHYEHLLALLHETARVPAIATGDLSHIGELSSGRAYEIAMRPFLSMCEERERVCEQQEADLMQTSIALLAYMGTKPFTGLTSGFGLGFDQPDPVKIEEALSEAHIEFAPLRLAEDALMAAQMHSTRIGAGYESEETAIRETHPDWSDDRVREELERVGSGKAAVTDASADLRIAQQQAELRAADGGNPTAKQDKKPAAGNEMADEDED